LASLTISFLSMGSSLVEWVNTFPNVSKRCNSLKDLSDGIQLSEILSQIIPKWIDLSQYKREAEFNDLLKLHNLKLILSSLHSYYKEELGLPKLSEELFVDVNAIVREGDEEYMKKLIQLIVGVVVECENKVEYIRTIMKMEPESQKELMILIEEVLSKHQLQKSFTKSNIQAEISSDENNENGSNPNTPLTKLLNDKHFGNYQPDLTSLDSRN